jgi:type I restriction enzyme S subunit
MNTISAKIQKPTRLASVAEVIFSNVDKSTMPGEIQVRLCNYTDVYNNRRIDSRLHFKRGTATPKEIERFRLLKGDVVITKDSESANDIAVPAYVAEDIPDLVCGYHLAILRPKIGMLDGRFLAQLLQLHHIRRYFATLANGITRFGLGTAAINEANITLPNLAIQRKIADILTTWDESSEKLDALIAVKERRKKSLMQQLLTGRIRLKGFSCKWPMQQMPNVFERVERKSTGTPQHVLSITSGKGFVDQSEKFSRVIAGRNIENYVLLKKGEFAYNKGNSDRYPQGCIYRLEEFEEGVVPNVWISFRLKAPTHSPLFYKHFFLAGGHNHQLHRLINAGVRNDGLLNLTPTNFFNICVPVPPESEQAQLGEMFESLAAELRLLRAQRVAFDQQKRGLIQHLLIDAVRVRLEKT